MILPDHRSYVRTRKRLAALTVAAALFAAACGGGDSALDTAEAGVAADAGASLLSGEFDTVGGGTIDLASLEGQDVVFWFWAPW